MNNEHPNDALPITPERPLPASGWQYRYEPRAAGQRIVTRHIVAGNRVICGLLRQGALALVYGGDTVLCPVCAEVMARRE